MKDRKPHILKPLQKALSKLRCLFIDVETETKRVEGNKQIQNFRLGYCIFSEMKDNSGLHIKERHQVHTIPEWSVHIGRLVRAKQNLYIISNNIWFDLRTSGIITWLLAHEWDVEYYFVKGLTVIISLQKGNYKIKCMNINQFVPGSVKKHGNLIGLPKLDIDLNTKDTVKLMEYCKRDTEIVALTFEEWVKFILKHDLGKFGMTLPSQSFIAYRTRFMKQQIFIHGRSDITGFERKAYYGGRNECFHVGKSPYPMTYCVDINSVYPYVMANKKIPYKVLGIKRNVLPKNLKKYLKKYFCIAYVALATNQPYFPYRGKERLLFPTGKFRTYLCSPELDIALQTGSIAEIETLVIYEQGYLFKDYVEYFNDLKVKYSNEGNEIYRTIAKLMMNSLYGKFGQKSDSIFLEETMETTEFSTEYCIREDDNSRWKIEQFGRKRRIVQEGVEEATHSFPAICAAVTSWSRRLLLEYMFIVGKRNFIYCDTDSLFINQKGLENLKEYLNPTKLGLLKQEWAAKCVQVNTCKDYRLCIKQKIKGVSKPGLNFASNTFDVLEFPGMRSEMKRCEMQEYAILNKTKTLSRKYLKGDVEQDGWVKPFILDEWEDKKKKTKK